MASWAVAFVLSVTAWAQSVDNHSAEIVVQNLDSQARSAVQRPAAEHDLQTKQLWDQRAQRIAWIRQKEAALAQEQQQINSSYENARQRFYAHKRAGDAVGMREAMAELNSIQAVAQDLQNRSFTFAETSQSSIDEYNNQLIISEADHAVSDLMNGDPSRAAMIVSEVGATPRRYQARTDGGFVIIDQNGKYILDESGNAKKFSAEDIAYEVYSVTGILKVSGADWDQFYNQYDQLVWACREIATGEFTFLQHCTGKFKTDRRWPSKSAE